MKKLLLFLFLSFSFFSKAQTNVYHPFPEDSAKWCFYSCTLDGGGYFNGTTYQLNGKLFMNGNWYNRVLTASVGCTPPGSCTCGHTSGPGAEFYIRQDTATKKVWKYNSSTNSDTIFLDFDLHVGDTLNSSREIWAWPSLESIVSSIDSTLIGSQYRRQYKYHLISSPSCINSMIEGIGPDQGFLPANDCFEHINTLAYFEDNQITWGDLMQEYYYCNDFTTTIKELNPISFTISPNPAHNKLNVECKMQNGELKIYDMMGMLVMEERIHSPVSIFNLQLAGGVYFLRVRDGEKVAVQKLIVE